MCYEDLAYNRFFGPGDFCLPFFSAVDCFGAEKRECDAPLFLVQQCGWRSNALSLCHTHFGPGIHLRAEYGTYYLLQEPDTDL